MRKIIMDVDTGTDDAIAIMAAVMAVSYTHLALALGGVYGVMTLVEVLFYGCGLSFFMVSCV